MLAFFNPNNKRLTAPYIPRYFDYLQRNGKELKWEFLSSYAEELFPNSGAKKTVREAKKFLNNPDIPTEVQQLIAKQLDKLEEVLKIRRNNR